MTRWKIAAVDIVASGVVGIVPQVGHFIFIDSDTLKTLPYLVPNLFCYLKSGIEHCNLFIRVFKCSLLDPQPRNNFPEHSRTI